jgi:hypothetical protein
MRHRGITSSAQTCAGVSQEKDMLEAGCLALLAGLLLLSGGLIKLCARL